MAILNESIKHLEDLDVRSFIAAVRRIGTMQATEKLDGANLWFGIDDEGKIFTSRAGKNVMAERFYSEQDYPYFAAYNGFRGVQAALMEKERDIKSVLSPGDTIEIEVLYGRQPNAVSYGLDGKNFIAVLQGVEGTSDVKADQLAGLLQNQEVTVKTVVVDTPDGENLDRKAMSQTFRFVGVQKIKPELIQSIDLEKELSALESYLDSKSGIESYSNFDLMTMSLGSIPKDKRAEAKEVKERVIAEVKSKYKVTIKNELLTKFVSQVKPALGAADLSNDEDNGVEGVVLKDPTTGEMIKLVDKDSFSTINQFNFAVRNQIAGPIRTIDADAPLEARGGVIGNMKIRIADLLGNAELALSREAKKIFAASKGDNPTMTLRNVAKTLDGSEDFNGTKRKIDAVIASTLDELGELLANFKKHKDDEKSAYRLKLKSGKTLGLSPEVVKRTLMTFAETKRNLVELLQKTKEAKAFDQLISVLYGRAAKSVHADGEVVEEQFEDTGSLLLEKRNYTDKARYSAVPDAWTLLNIYTATVLMTVLIYKADDTRGIRLVRDKAHYRMSSWTPEMSALNFWGYPVWHASSPAVAKLIGKKTASEIYKVTRKVPPQWVKFLHMDLSFGRDVPIDWTDHFKTMKWLNQHAAGMSTDRINKLLTSGFNYDTLSFDEKVKYLPKLYFYAQQFVPTSPLLTRVKVIQNSLLGGDVETPLVLTKGQKLLGEDGEIATGTPVDSTALSNATTSANIESVPTGIGRHAQIIRRKRNPDIKFVKFKRPQKEAE
jgi:hypothetical protein